MATPRIYPEGGGIYALRNSTNGKFYIGSTSQFSRRWDYHKRFLNKGTHGNPHLQSAWNKYGSEAFAFDVVEVVTDRDQLYPREQHYLDTMNPFEGAGYNQNRYATGPRGMTHTDEAKRKISESGKGRKWSDAQRLKTKDRIYPPSFGAKISAAKKGITTTSDKQREILRQKGKERGISPALRAATSAAHKGQKRSEEWKANLRAGLVKRAAMERDGVGASTMTTHNIHTYLIGRVNEAQGLVSNLSQFCRENDLRITAMLDIAAGRGKTHRGWTCNRPLVSD